MKQEIIVQLNKDFEGSARVENGVEFCMARDIQDRFADVSKMVDLGSGSQRSAEDMKLMWATEK